MSRLFKHSCSSLTLLFLFMFIKKDVYPQLYPPYRGTIVSADDATSVSGVTISNLTRKQKTNSDRKGNFSILFGPNDSIEFRLSGWKTKMVLFSALGDSIFLTKRSIELQEVVVVHDRGSSRLENLKGINRARNKRKGIYYQGRPPITLLSPFGGKPLTFFYGTTLQKWKKRPRNVTTNCL